MVDIATGILDASESTRGTLDELIELQNRLAGELLTALRRADLRRRAGAALRQADQRDARRLPPPGRHLRRGAGRGRRRRAAGKGKTSWLAWPRAAWAEEAPAAEPAIRAVLEAYRAALEAKDVAAVAAVHVELAPDQRDGFTRYFASADDLNGRAQRRRRAARRRRGAGHLHAPRRVQGPLQRQAGGAGGAALERRRAAERTLADARREALVVSRGGAAASEGRFEAHERDRARCARPRRSAGTTTFTNAKIVSRQSSPRPPSERS